MLNWDDKWKKNLNKTTIIINLAIKSINCLFTKKNSKAIQSLIPLVKLDLGGKQCYGKQLFSFIDQSDFVLSIAHIINTNILSGGINLIAPSPTTNENFMKEFRKKLQVKIRLPTLSFLLHLSKYITKIAPEIILTSLF